ncbi:MAG: selenide, water dikinase SelD, partial [Proteobacteria bacterium]|nr:selenide, water dikinase SelD [Pseudomonadota bacterium]
MPPGALMQVLRQFTDVSDKDLLVGVGDSDDAGVYRIAPDKAVILTIDFFPPIVDDPVTFGKVAAANALSDIYAMGGEPALAMNVVCFPEELPISVLNDILAGSMEKLKEAGVLVVGGHSITDKEVKFGLSLTGFVHPDKIITNAGAKAGDVLILTKPIGTGVVTSAMKSKKASKQESEAALKCMLTLNKAASSAMIALKGGVNACTDVTGFGLLGHAMEICRASSVGMTIEAEKVPLLPGAKLLISKKKFRPKNIKENMDFILPDISITSKLDEDLYTLLFDPQTSGGLLISVPGERAGLLLEALKVAGVEASSV